MESTKKGAAHTFTQNEIELMKIISKDPNPAEAIEIALKIVLDYLQKGNLA